MSESPQREKIVFDTRSPYAIVSGLLILPALGAILIFLSSLFIVIFSNPTQLDNLEIFTYFISLFLIPYSLVAFYTWIKRKRILRPLMVVFFAIQAIWSIYYMILGLENEFVNIFISVVWLVYFIVSRRVKQTFIN